MSGCVTSSSTRLTVQNAKTSDYLAIFNVNNVVLPSFVSSFFVLLTSYDQNGAQIETSGPTVFRITTQPDRLDVTLQPSSNVVG